VEFLAQGAKSSEEAERRRLVLEAQTGDPTARRELVAAFMPLVARAARGYRWSGGVERDELIQEGVVGVLRALERFDPELGTPFWGYASWWVRQAMQQLVCELTGPVVLSDRAVRQLTRLKAAQRAHQQALGAQPTSAQLAERTGLTMRQIQDLWAAERRPRGLDEPLGRDGDSSSTFEDLIADPCAQDAFDRVPQSIEVEHVPELLDRLTDRERRVVRARFGLDGNERTLRELAVDFGVSAERVRQIEERALDKMRVAAAA
jgi:RNA polymerase primary sigma factor